MNIVFDWDNDKNQKLITTRGISFEEVVAVLEAGHALDIIEHPNQEKYSHQKIYVVEISGYIHLVPFVRERNRIFLKTIIPSRKAHKKYFGKSDKESNL